jgi:hypothetical protein
VKLDIPSDRRTKSKPKAYQAGTRAAATTHLHGYSILRNSFFLWKYISTIFNIWGYYKNEIKNAHGRPICTLRYFRNVVGYELNGWD